MMNEGIAADPAVRTPTAAPSRRFLLVRRMAAGGAALLVAAAAALAWGEWRGWPWLAGWSEGWLSGQLGRELRWRPPEAPSGSAPGWRLSLIGPLRLQAADLAVADPAGAAAARPPAPEGLPAGWTLHARDLDLRLRWRDLLAWRRGEPLRIEQVGIGHIAARLQREADGRANWLLERAADAPARPRPAVQIGTLWLREGRLAIDDRPLALQADAVFSLDERGVKLRSGGRWRQQPLSLALETGSPLPWIAAGAVAPVGFALSLEAGATLLRAQGRVRDLLGLRGLDTGFTLSGPSLARVGEPLGLTLPTTASFRAQGRLLREPAEASPWRLQLAQARIGRSELSGDFVLDTAAARPQLGGTLRGRALWLADLGPAIGVPAQAAERQAAAADGRILPDRRFDLPSLDRMDAALTVSLDRLELGEAFARPIAPLQARLRLQQAVLSIDELAARVGSGGQITGSIGLDARGAQARWTTALRATGVPLEDWLRQTRASGAGPWISGRLSGDLLMQGQGRSTAELLASADGRLRLGITQGRMSQLALEAAGIDVAQALGLLLVGDRGLPLRCAVADLQVRDGTATPRVMLVDTPDSLVVVDGALSLATEQLMLRARVRPHDFSPLSLRTPIDVRGTLARPKVSLDTRGLVQRLLPSALLALVTPAAALLPLLDPGDGGSDAGCRDLASRLGTASDRRGAGR